MQYGLDLNLFGDNQINNVYFMFLLGHSSICSYLVKEFMCRVNIPQCYMKSNQIILPCIEMCHQYFYKCDMIPPVWIDYDYLPSFFGEDIPCIHRTIICHDPLRVENEIPSSYQKRGNYSLLDKVKDSCNGDFELVENNTIMCKNRGLWYEPLWCVFTNISTAGSIVESIAERELRVKFSTQPRQSTAEQRSEFTGDEKKNPLTSNTTAAPEPSPESSSEATIESETILPIYYLVATLSILFLLLTILFLLYKIKLKSAKNLDFHKKQVQDDKVLADVNVVNEPLLPLRRKQKSGIVSVTPAIRDRTFDDFVLYHFDSDADFVLNHLLPELEETRNF